MSKNFWKGLIMAIIAFVSSTISDQLSVGVINWVYVAVASAGIIVTYFGKNAVYQSISNRFSLDFKDFLSGLFLAIGAAVSSCAASILTTDVVNWKAIGIAVLSTAVGYVTKTFVSGTKQITV